MIIIRYLISGGTAAIVNLSSLYVLTEFLGLWYLASATIAFILAFFVGFGLQKFWTFQCDNKEKTHYQMSLYFILGIINLVINAGIIYFLVEKFNLWYMLSQFISAGFLAVFSFLFYRFVIFSHMFDIDK